MTITTEEAERLAKEYGGFWGLHDVAAALRSLATEREALQARVAELEGALRQIEYLDRPQIRGLPRRVSIQEIALAALEGKKDE